MACLKAEFVIFYALCSRESPFERVNLRRAARHSRRRTDNWSFRQYIESPVRPCPQPRHPPSVLQQPSRLSPTKLIYEPSFLKMFPKLVFVESSCVLGGAPPFAAPSRIHWVTPFLDAKLNAPVVTQGYYLEDVPVAYP